MANAGVGKSQKVKLLSKTPLSTDGMLAPLNGTGIVFPYTPTISIGHGANYGTYDTTHSIYQPHYYINTPNPTINVTAQFTAQSMDEAKYAAAALHFLKVATKSDFGKVNRNSTAGTPPPVLLFSGYGGLHADNIPVVLKSFQYTLVEDVDYVSFEMPEVGEVSIPTLFVVGFDLGVQITPTKTLDFDIKKYSSGSLLKGGFM